MVIDVSTHILQIVVLATCAHALLAVHHSPIACQLTPWICRAQENGFELESLKGAKSKSYIYENSKWVSRGDQARIWLYYTCDAIEIHRGRWHL